MQLIQLEMMVEFDRLCKQEGIHYCICCGTLLGAVRHKGYIPWDDDSDIAMLRKEYEKFQKVAHKLNQEICFFQDHTTDPEYRWGYGKLRKTGTTYIRLGQEHIHCKTGVYVDIFPLDDIPKTTIGQIINDAECFLWRKVLYAEVGRVSPDSNPVQRLIYEWLAKIPTDFVFEKMRHITDKSNNRTNNRVRVLLFPSFGRLYVKNPVREMYGMPKKWFKQIRRYTFEGKQLDGIRDYDAFLKYMYDDYMTLPPEEQRTGKVYVSDYDLGDEEVTDCTVGADNGKEPT